MAYGGGGGGGRGGHHGDRPSCFVWPSTPRSVPILGTGYLGPTVPPRRRGAHGMLAAVYRGAPTPATPQVSLSPAPAAAVPVTTTRADDAQRATAADGAGEPSYVDLASRSRNGLHRLLDIDLAKLRRKGLIDVDPAPLSREVPARPGLERLVAVNPAPLSKEVLARPARPGLEHLVDVNLAPLIEAFTTNILKPLEAVMKFAEEFLSLCDTSQHLSGRHHVRVGICPKSKLARAISEKKKSRETKKKILAQLVKLFFETSLDGKILTTMKDRESFKTFGMRKVLKDIASRLARKFKKFSEKMTTCHLKNVIDRVNSRLARKLLKETVTAVTAPTISRPSKDVVVECPQTRDLMVGIGHCWRYLSPQPEVIITRPVAVKYFRPLDQVLADIQMKFDYVFLPDNLKQPSSRNFVCFLNNLSQNLIHQLLVTVCREGHEVRNVCWHGAFELSDIWLSEGHLKVNPYLDYSVYTEEGGRKDYEKLHELIFKAFYDPATQEHPCLLGSLLDLLNRAPEVKRRDHDFITYLINHPCLLSYTERLKILFVLEKMVEKLKPPYSTLLEQVLSKDSGWGSMIQDVVELNDAYFYGGGVDAAGKKRSVYGKGLDQAFRFARNFLNHTRSTVQSLKEAEAALCFVLPLMLHTVLLLLMLTFVGPPTWDLMAVISMKNADRTEAQFGWDWVELPASTNLYKKPRLH